MSNLHDSYTKIYALLHELDPMSNFLNQIRKPKLSDKQLIALTLAAEALGINSERYLFKQLPPSVTGKIERSVYNRRRRQLGFKMEAFRQPMVTHLAPSTPCYLNDVQTQLSNCLRLQALNSLPQCVKTRMILKRLVRYSEKHANGSKHCSLSCVISL